ncbi:hypothetical protein SDC9_161980 [bioreactor metagenome]|uniref:HTH marR-type domain-containing protein n=1 Tax=bioreactor metagenome TaxID=1076179 RepID=A0A645FR43_9ZZZZ
MILKLFEERSQALGQQYGLSFFELGLLRFLDQRPSQDTASDVIALRRVPKANVSKAVERLIRKGLLIRLPDAADRRRIHLGLTPEAKELMPLFDQVISQTIGELFADFTPDEQLIYQQLNQRIIANTYRGLESR